MPITWSMLGSPKVKVGLRMTDPDFDEIPRQGNGCIIGSSVPVFVRGGLLTKMTPAWRRLKGGWLPFLPRVPRCGAGWRLALAGNPWIGTTVSMYRWIVFPGKNLPCDRFDKRPRPWNNNQSELSQLIGSKRERVDVADPDAGLRWHRDAHRDPAAEAGKSRDSKGFDILRRRAGEVEWAWAGHRWLARPADLWTVKQRLSKNYYRSHNFDCCAHWHPRLHTVQCPQCGFHNATVSANRHFLNSSTRVALWTNKKMSNHAPTYSSMRCCLLHCMSYIEQHSSCFLCKRWVR